MSFESERIARLEEIVSRLEADLRVAAALPINAMRVALDKLVDERKLDAAWRAELWNSVAAEVRKAAAGSDLVSRAAGYAIPRGVRPVKIPSPDRVRKALLRPTSDKD